MERETTSPIRSKYATDMVVVPITEEGLDDLDEDSPGNVNADESPEFSFVAGHGERGPKGAHPPKTPSFQTSEIPRRSSLKQRRKSSRVLPRRGPAEEYKIPKSDPPTILIENFLQRQAASGNWCLDMDMEMIDKLPQTLASEESLTVTRSNVDPSNENFINVADRNKSLANTGGKIGLEETNQVASASQSSANDGRRCIMFCENIEMEKSPCNTSNDTEAAFTDPNLTRAGDNIASRNAARGERSTSGDEDDYRNSSEDDAETFSQRNPVLSSLMRIQTRSRMADPPPLMQQNAGVYRSAQLRSGPMRSGMIQKSGYMVRPDSIEEEDDPLKDSDMPDGFKARRVSPLLIFEWILFFIIMAALICSLTIPALRKRPLWSMALWKWALLVFLIFSGRLVSGWVIGILVVILERNFLLRKRVLYFVYGLRKGAIRFIWFALAVLAWRLVFDPKLEKTTNTKVLPFVTKILHCLLIGAAIWLVKIFCVKVLASSFHVSTYFERIRESLFGQWVLESLSGPPLVELEAEEHLVQEIDGLRKAGAKIPESMVLKETQHSQKAGKNKNYVHMQSKGSHGKHVDGKGGLGKSGLIGGGKSSLLGLAKGGATTPNAGGKSGLMGRSGMLRVKSQHFNVEKISAPEEQAIDISDLHRLNQRNISAWNMKRMINFVRYRSVCTLAQVIDNAGNQLEEEPQDVEIESEWQARTVARRIFKNVAKPGARFIVRDDLLRFMREREADKAMTLFEGAMDTGKITKSALKEFAMHVVRERRALSLSLNDTRTAVKKLHRLVDAVVGVVIAVVCLLVLGIATTHLLLLVSSQLVLVVFIFGNTCKTVFEAIVFLFVMHPFDVGDRCVVDGNQVVVEEMNILSTVFVRNDGEKIWYPNSLLSSKFIFNYHCTPDMGDAFEFCIDSSTPSNKITALKDRIAKYITSKPGHWSRDFELLVKDVENNNKMTMRLQVSHTINYNNPGERQIRRSDLILEVKKILQELGFAYHLPVQGIRLENANAPPTCESCSRRRVHIAVAPVEERM
ncbi:hypothetical protein KP509_07G023800 [Ceratopteris richardii]|uniref:Mechanosensitive ion channel protein n=1 Tax=Ceratopteris richardii TaxID=49495 RepID=A0A8T2UGL0_CERRI|nr:hypothetical protein KP509_07G023800 [Ceratopteris richardii]